MKRTKPKGHTLTKAQERTQRTDTREALKTKKAILREAQKAKREALKDAREQIRAARKALPAKLAHWREVNRQIIKRAIEGERHAVMAERLQLRTGIKGRAHEMITAANEAIDRDLKHLRWLGKRRHKVTSSARVAAGLKAAETRHEQDEFVRNELPTELHAAWEENKHKIKAKPHTPRWEVAIEYFEEHPEVVAEANARVVDLGIKDLIEREHQERANQWPASIDDEERRNGGKPTKAERAYRRWEDRANPRPKTPRKPARKARQYVSSAARELVPEHYGKKAAKRSKASKPPKAPKAKRSKASKRAKPAGAAPESVEGYSFTGPRTYLDEDLFVQRWASKPSTWLRAFKRSNGSGWYVTAYPSRAAAVAGEFGQLKPPKKVKAAKRSKLSAVPF